MAAGLLLLTLRAAPAAAQDFTLQEVVVGAAAAGTGTAGSLKLTSTAGQDAGGRVQAGTFVLFSGFPSPFAGRFVIVINHTPPADPPPTSGNPQALDVQIITRVAEIETATLFYRPGDATEFTSVEMTQTEDGYNATIPADAVTSRGVAYYFMATDTDGNTSRAPGQGAFSFPIRIPDPGIAKPSAQPGGASQGAYRLISVPIDLDDKNPTAVLGDDIPTLASESAYDPSEARFFEPIGRTVAEFPRTDAMNAGTAFWLIVRSGASDIDTGTGTVFSIDDPFRIELDEGWNFVANPFNVPIPVGNLRIADGQEVGLNRYDENGWSGPSSIATMEPFSGYALFSETDTDLIVDPDITSDGSSAQTRDVAKAIASTATKDAPEHWAIRIVGTTSTARDANSVAAVHSSATDGRDAALDWPDPPPIGADFTVSFAHPDWSSRTSLFSTDVRAVPDPAEGASWPLEVRGGADEAATLSFQGIDDVPTHFDVWLLDESTKATRDLRSAAQYRVENLVADEPRRLRLFVGQADFVKGKLADAGALPKQFVVEGPYPNPSVDRATIRFGLPAAERVSAHVYNILGQRVATLAEERSMPAGFHTLTWNDARASSGVYFIRFRAGDFTSTQKLIRVR